MTAQTVRLAFSQVVDMGNIENDVTLAALATEGVHGRVALRLELFFRLDKAERTLEIETWTPCGKTMAQIFMALVTHEIGEEEVRVQGVIIGRPL